MRGTVFINYRKDDSSWNALALYNELQKYLPRETIFKDFNTIRPGDDFVESIQKALSHCNVLLVVISKHWLDVKDKNGNRRLDDPDDLVRIEVATAIERNIQVIPVLFDNVPMPTSDQLPENLRSLPRRQFIEIETTRFEADVKKLADAIKELLPPEKPGTGGKETTPDYNRNRNQTHQQTQHVNRPVYNEPQNVIGAGNKPDNYLVWAILTTVLCCFVVGIPSIIYSTKVDSLWAAGQYAEARAASEKAKQFAIYSAIAAVVCWVLYFVLVVAGSMGGGY